MRSRALLAALLAIMAAPARAMLYSMPERSRLLVLTAILQ
jgi:hypothetical protein